MAHEYERVMTPSSGLRLHLNENTAGCSPRVMDALRTLTREDAAFYPDYEETIAACARRVGVEPDRLQLTNGLDEGILACSVAAMRGSSGTGEALVIVPAFDMYAACADAAGARVVELRHEGDWQFPLEAALRAVGPQTRLVFLTTPNNPTGRTIPRESVLKLAVAASNALVLVDEAYIDFGGETLLELDDRLLPPNLIVGRTFAKAYGLAAVRAGALIGSPRTLAQIRRTIPPFSVNVFATVALRAALEDTAYYTWYLDQVRTSKGLLYAALDRCKVRYWKSDANFVFADFSQDARRVVDGLAARQIHVRDKSRDPACPGCLRITTGVVDHTQACINALEEVLCGAAS
jgi:histidinol-phosphate aminotransferase